MKKHEELPSGPPKPGREGSKAAQAAASSNAPEQAKQDAEDAEEKRQQQIEADRVAQQAQLAEDVRQASEKLEHDAAQMAAQLRAQHDEAMRRLETATSTTGTVITEHVAEEHQPREQRQPVRRETTERRTTITRETDRDRTETAAPTENWFRKSWKLILAIVLFLVVVAVLLFLWRNARKAGEVVAAKLETELAQARQKAIDAETSRAEAEFKAKEAQAKLLAKPEPVKTEPAPPVAPKAEVVLENRAPAGPEGTNSVQTLRSTGAPSVTNIQVVAIGNSGKIIVAGGSLIVSSHDVMQAAPAAPAKKSKRRVLPENCCGAGDEPIIIEPGHSVSTDVRGHYFDYDDPTGNAEAWYTTCAAPTNWVRYLPNGSRPKGVREVELRVPEHAPEAKVKVKKIRK